LVNRKKNHHPRKARTRDPRTRRNPKRRRRRRRRKKSWKTRKRSLRRVSAYFFNYWGDTYLD
jgi:hypothetical protein